MKINFGIIAIALLMLFGISQETHAQGRINTRQGNQIDRVRNGVRSGELTARETARLAREQVQINRMEQRYRASGDGLSTRERARLQHEQNQASRHIYRQKHDRQDYDFRRP